MAGFARKSSKSVNDMIEDRCPVHEIEVRVRNFPNEVNAPNKQGYTPLITALTGRIWDRATQKYTDLLYELSDRLKLAKLLIKAGARVDVGGKSNKSGRERLPLPLQLAKDRRLDEVRLIVELKPESAHFENVVAGKTLLHYVAVTGDIPLIELLLEKNTDPRRLTEQGNYPAHYAAAGGHGEATKLLMKVAELKGKENNHMAWSIIGKFLKTTMRRYHRAQWGGRAPPPDHEDSDADCDNARPSDLSDEMKAARLQLVERIVDEYFPETKDYALADWEKQEHKYRLRAC